MASNSSKAAEHKGLLQHTDGRSDPKETCLRVGPCHSVGLPPRITACVGQVSPFPCPVTQQSFLPLRHPQPRLLPHREVFHASRVAEAFVCEIALEAKIPCSTGVHCFSPLEALFPFRWGLEIKEIGMEICGTI